MKKVFRNEDNKSYWNRRWTDAIEDAGEFLSLDIYPIRYAENVISQVPGRIIEIGCGLGRLVKHYDYNGRDIVGIERSNVAVQRIQSKCPDLDVRPGDALNLHFDDSEFDIALAFGVYHNFEFGLGKGIYEISRILKPGGHFVISMRPDNIEMNLNEMYWRYKSNSSLSSCNVFHKLLVTEAEFQALLSSHDLIVSKTYRARNMSILFRLPFLQSSEIRNAPESTRRAIGYKLNFCGRLLDKILTGLFPSQFCNVIVFEGRKI